VRLRKPGELPAPRRAPRASRRRRHPQGASISRCWDRGHCGDHRRLVVRGQVRGAGRRLLGRPGPGVNLSRWRPGRPHRDRTRPDGAVLNNASLAGARLDRAVLDRADLRFRTSPRPAPLCACPRTLLKGRICVAADLANADLSGADLGYAISRARAGRRDPRRSASGQRDLDGRSALRAGSLAAACPHPERSSFRRCSPRRAGRGAQRRCSRTSALECADLASSAWRAGAGCRPVADRDRDVAKPAQVADAADRRASVRRRNSALPTRTARSASLGRVVARQEVRLRRERATGSRTDQLTVVAAVDAVAERRGTVRDGTSSSIVSRRCSGRVQTVGATMARVGQTSRQALQRAMPGRRRVDGSGSPCRSRRGRTRSPRPGDQVWCACDPAQSSLLGQGLLQHRRRVHEHPVAERSDRAAMRVASRCSGAQDPVVVATERVARDEREGRVGEDRRDVAGRREVVEPRADHAQRACDQLRGATAPFARAAPCTPSSPCSPARATARDGPRRRAGRCRRCRPPADRAQHPALDLAGERGPVVRVR